VLRLDAGEQDDVSQTELQIRLRDTYYPFFVTLHYRVHADYDLIERWATMTNAGDGVCLYACQYRHQRLGFRLAVGRTTIVYDAEQLRRLYDRGLRRGQPSPARFHTRSRSATSRRAPQGAL
jgi:Glycosyl hydrolase family 36 N-terminal domain